MHRILHIVLIVFTLATSAASANECSFLDDKDAAGIFVLGIPFVTVPLALLDYEISKASAYERTLPSDKQLEFIVGAPLLAAVVAHMLSPAQSCLNGSDKRAMQLSPFIIENGAGVSFTVRF